MLSVSNEYLKSVVSDTRDMPYRVTFDGGLTLDKTKIPKMSLDENVGSNEGVALGTANSATFRFTLKDADAVNYNGMLIEPESGLVLPDGTVEWLPLGRFWVTDFTTSNEFKTVEFTCADGMYHMTGEYVSRLTYPAHVKDVAHEIVSQTGVEFEEPTEWPEVYIRRKPEGLTHREAIGHVAGCCGRNARFNRYGKLEFTWYNDSGIAINREIQYLDGLTKTNYKPLEVNFEVTGQVETYVVNVVSDGNGGITATPGQNIFENETVVLSVNPFGGYELATIYAETEHGEEVTLYYNSEGGYTFVQPDSNVTVTASFRAKEAKAYKLTVRAYDGGSISYSTSDNELGENYFNEGDSVRIHITPDYGKQIDKIVTTPHDIGLTNGTFTMPSSDVTITVYFKDAELVITPYSWLQKPKAPPSSKPYWAIFYRDDANLPTCQKYYLIWFDSWSATFYDTDVYKIQINGYWYCGSVYKKSYGALHSWDTTTWNGNGNTSSYINWYSHIGYMSSGTDNERIDARYCLLVSNADLLCNGSTIFEANEDVITETQTSYIQDDMDIRERGSLSYWSCPDTFSTPAPSENWMVLMPGSGLYMTMDSEGKYQTGISSYPQTMIAFFYDSIEIFSIGHKDTSSDENFYLALPVNGRWAYLRPDGVGWDELHALPEGAFIGFRNPLVSTEPKFIYDNGNSYQFSGILATNKTLNVSGETLIYNNACRICDCVFETPKARMFSLMRSTVSDSIVIDCENIAVSEENDTLILDSTQITASSDGDSIVLNIISFPTDTEKVTLSYTNPLIYEKMVESISNCVQGMVYTPAKVKYRGNPALQAGDTVIVPDKNGVGHNILIIQQTLNFGGGLNGEISCPGKTEKTKSFSAISPVTTQIKKEVQKSNVELEKRLAANNALVFNSMYKEIGDTESKIRSVVEWQGATNSTIAEIEQAATEDRAKIALVVGQNGIVNESGAVQGSVVIEAINDTSEATISADKINFEGQELNVKVNASNIEGKLKANQINADGLEVTNAKITGDATVGCILISGGAIYEGTDTGSTTWTQRYYVRWEITGTDGITMYVWGYVRDEETDDEVKIAEDIEVTIIVSGKPYRKVMPKGSHEISFATPLGVLTPPRYIYVYADDTYITVSKGIMPDNSLNLGAPNHAWKEIYADTSTINTSDERAKNSIAEIPQKYSDLFYKLQPVIYKLNNGTSDRYHVGFGAQSVETAMTESGIDSQEFAGFIKSPVGDDYKYGLRYSEFIALAVKEIQRLNKKIIELEEKIK
jgi:hypothetical protein